MGGADDRLCREAGLSVVERTGGRRKSYSEWKAEQDGVPTQRSTIRADIDRSVASATTEQGFIRTLQEMGYQFKTRRADGERLKYPALKPPGAKNFFRFHRLGDGYGLDEIINRVYENMRKESAFPRSGARGCISAPTGNVEPPDYEVQGPAGTVLSLLL